MRSIGSLFIVALALGLVGCAGPERKLGRGLRNATEVFRGGEMHRSIEQTSLWEGADRGRTTGFIRGFNRTMARTGVGLYEIVTFPFPSYDPLLTSKHPIYADHSVQTRHENWGGLVQPENPAYPASYKPGLTSDSIFNTDTTLGFSGGDIAPIIPGSRFRVFDN